MHGGRGVLYIAVIFKMLAVFECYSILGNSVTCRNIVEVQLRQSRGKVDLNMLEKSQK